jgi:putative endonuclease
LAKNARKKYLSEKGYKIRETNWVTGKLELDIIAEKDGMLVIVEVKTRSTEYFEHPKKRLLCEKSGI